MQARRILSLWFPRLAAERHLRRAPGLADAPFAVLREAAQMQVLAALSAGAEAAGLRPGQPLRDALAMCPSLVTRPEAPEAEAAFLAGLRRWAGKFSPWIAEEPPAGLLIDITGVAHLFGGEAALLAEAEAGCAGLGLTVRGAIADTPGAAWALARHAGQGVAAHRSGDAVEQEARATRARAARRRPWERGGPAPLPPPLGTAAAPPPGLPHGQIAPRGQTRSALAPLPVAALRLPEDTVAALARLGLRRIEDLMGPARAPLARRFGRELVWRLDQALGLEPEPVSPARADTRFAVRIGFPEPIGLAEDIAAAVERLLPRLCERLAERGRGARRLRLQAERSDGRTVSVEVGLARPSAEPERLRPLLAMKLDAIEAGFGIDRLRLVAVQTEPVHPHQHRGPLQPGAAAAAKPGAGLDDLIGRIGARIGLEAITRLHPAESHIPEKAAQVLAAAWSEPAGPWPEPARPRPLLLIRPEPIAAPELAEPPLAFRWRRREHRLASASGPERIAPEWWLDEPDWRTGVRDYWRVETEDGTRLWLYFAHGGPAPGGWFCHGSFA